MVNRLEEEIEITIQTDDESGDRTRIFNKSGLFNNSPINLKPR